MEEAVWRRKFRSSLARLGVLRGRHISQALLVKRRLGMMCIFQHPATSGSHDGACPRNVALGNVALEMYIADGMISA